MILPTSYRDKTVAVMGLGKSGLIAAAALAAAGARVLAWDDGQAGRDAAAARGCRVCDLLQAEWQEIAALVLSPGIPHTHPVAHPVAAAAKAAGVPIIGDVDLLVRTRPQARYIGITGTNGKSTTTALLGHILRELGRPVAVGGNLGVPALALDPMDADGTYVLELSSFQLDLTPSLASDVAVLTNISADHLDRHGGMAGYIAAKRRLFDQQRPGATAVIGTDDPDSAALCDAFSRDGARRVLPVSSGHRVRGGAYVIDGMLHDDLGGTNAPVLALADIPTLPGVHNHQNAAAAYAAARAAGLDAAGIARAIRSYPGLPHRQELVAEIDGVRYINDSKATNADSAARALACYDTIYWIAGGKPKEGGLDLLAPYLRNVRHAFLIGEAAPAMRDDLARRGGPKTTMSGDLETALGAAHAMAQREGTPGAVVLLSPACASYDQFANFEARGDRFRHAVGGLPGSVRRFAQSGRAA
ncbi:MAG: UDP-N-acetylmuramoyl-L-alanine--D-glutamate ligase [Alphaproteobacteria bacterium]